MCFSHQKHLASDNRKVNNSHLLHMQSKQGIQYADININNNNNTRLTAIFHVNPGKPISECHHSEFYRSKDDGRGCATGVT